jgi:cell division protein FtsB
LKGFGGTRGKITLYTKQSTLLYAQLSQFSVIIEGVIMLVSLIVSVILGAIVAGVTGISFLFWVVAIFAFVCSLPFVLVDGYIQSKIDYAQDREDERQSMRDLAEEDRFYEHEMYEDERLDRYIDESNKKPTHFIYNDNRQVHYHNSSNGEKKIIGRRKNS